MSSQVKLIQYLLNVNENLFFYPKLAVCYNAIIKAESPVIFDVGANKGQTISFFLKIFPKAEIYAFEPNPKSFKHLIKKFDCLANVHLFNKGISNINGQLILKETVMDETSSFEELNFDSNYLKRKAKILGVKIKDIIVEKYAAEVERLEKVIADLNLTHIDILKIDTEGHEYKCLLGLFSDQDTQVDYIQLEHHNDDMYLNNHGYDMIVDLLKKNGYNQKKVIKHGFGDFDEFVFGKNLI